MKTKRSIKKLKEFSFANSIILCCSYNTSWRVIPPHILHLSLSAIFLWSPVLCLYRLVTFLLLFCLVRWPSLSLRWCPVWLLLLHVLVHGLALVAASFGLPDVVLLLVTPPRTSIFSTGSSSRCLSVSPVVPVALSRCLCLFLPSLTPVSQHLFSNFYSTECFCLLF